MSNGCFADAGAPAEALALSRGDDGDDATDVGGLDNGDCTTDSPSDFELVSDPFRFDAQSTNCFTLFDKNFGALVPFFVHFAALANSSLTTSDV